MFCRLHGNVETMAVLSSGSGDGSKRRDSIILSFQDAKISVLEFDDSIHGLRTRWAKGDAGNGGKVSFFITVLFCVNHVYEIDIFEHLGISSVTYPKPL